MFLRPSSKTDVINLNKNWPLRIIGTLLSYSANIFSGFNCHALRAWIKLRNKKLGFSPIGSLAKAKGIQRLFITRPKERGN